MKKRIISLLLAVCFVVGMFPITVHAASSGTCGEHLTWTLDSATGKLIIEGYGDMYDLNYITSQPWWLANQTIGIKSIQLPEGLTSIGARMFASLENLTSIEIPSGVTSIGHYAFSSCSNLSSIVIPSTVEKINGYDPFSGCAITSAGPIGSGCDCEFGWTDTIPDFVFSKCAKLKKVTIPDGISTVGSFAFQYCTSLESIEIPLSVNVFGQNVFNGCEMLREITLPNGITSISYEMFRNCKQLQEITIPNGVTEIGMYAFEQCIQLSDIVIPDTVTTISSGAFSYCTNLSKVTIPGSVTSCDSPFYGDSSLTSAGPIGSGCSIEFGWNNIIPANALYGSTGLTSVIIPESISAIKSKAFRECNSLESVFFYGNAPSVYVASSSNRSFPENTTLYYITGTTGWTDTSAYDAEAGTWHGYKLATWDGLQPDEPDDQNALKLVSQYPEVDSVTLITKENPLKITMICSPSSRQ